MGSVDTISEPTGRDIHYWCCEIVTSYKNITYGRYIKATERKTVSRMSSA
jgi:hypothetical protein